MDIKTLLIVIATVNLFLGIFITAIKQKHYKAIEYWIAINFLVAGSITLILLRNKIPDFFSIVLANTILFSTLILRFVGYKKLINSKITNAEKIITATLFVTVIAVYIIFSLWKENLLARMMSYNFYMFIIGLLIGLFLLKSKKNNYAKIYNYIAFTFFLFSAAYLSKNIGLVLSPNYNHFLQSNFYNTFALVLQIALDIIWSISLLLIYAEMAIQQQKQSEVRYKTLSELTFEGILIHKHGVAIDVNMAFTRITGYKPNEVVGVNLITKLIHPNDLPIVQNHVGHEKIEPYQVRAYIKDGSCIYVELESRYFYTNNTKLRVTAIRNLTSRKKHEHALKQAQQEAAKLKAAIEQSSNSIFLTDTNGNIEYVNAGFTKVTGYTANEVIGKNPRFLKSGYKSKADYEEFWQTILAGNTWKGEFYNKRKDDTLFWEKGTISPIFNDQGEITNFLAVKEDISRQKYAEQQLRQSEEKYRLITENASDVITILNLTKQKFTYVSPSVYNLRGYTAEEAMQQDINQTFTPESAQLVKEKVKERIPMLMNNPQEISQKVFVNQLQQPHKNGSIIWIETTTRYRLNKDNEIEVISISRNIDERKKMEKLLENETKQLKAALKTKEILLKEVHHRVKNNLQTIVSLLNQQKALSKNPQIANALRDSMSRVMSMALVHQFIYRSHDLENVNMKKYIDELVKKLSDAYKDKKQGIQINTQLEELFLNTNKTMPVALIINEILSNAFKYAFAEKENGTIELQFFKTDEKKHRLYISDNGIGFSENLDLHKSKTLGMYLIKNFVKRQLKGKLQIQSKPGKGVKYEIIF